ncbi:hypothetical protein ACFVQ9_35560 [Streptomyces goshikiensis]|uniref:hypothetical protein n=1 Tax=Streptomyces goshikiensis TaxID=1942 RepID=UPI0036BDCA09
MARTQRTGPIDVNKLVELLDKARESVAYDADKHHYARHHSERSDLDSEFDNLIDWARRHQDAAELAALVKSVSDPDLQPGDMILLDGSPVTVRQIKIHAQHAHPDSGLPAHRPALELVTGRGSEFFTLTPQVPNGA